MIHFSTWWVTSWIFLSVYSPDWCCSISLSSLHSLKTTHIWWNVSKIRCCFFVFCFVFWKWKDSSVCRLLLCLTSFLKNKKTLEEPGGRCFTQQPWICMSGWHNHTHQHWAQAFYTAILLKCFEWNVKNAALDLDKLTKDIRKQNISSIRYVDWLLERKSARCCLNWSVGQVKVLNCTFFNQKANAVL